MKLFPALNETLAGTSRAIRQRQRSCVEVVEHCLAQIDAREAEVKAWVKVDRKGALQQARKLDAELKQGRPRGVLHGIPIGIKDIVDVEGFVTGCGSSWMAKERSKAIQDAVLVTQLRNAGAIVLGKTVTTQFASFDPPPTCNPWNLDRTPGGSSSGSAAAVAAGMCLGAIGSQTGGSLTRPASFCGISTCKPTYDAVPVEGVFPLAPSMDHPGPMARTVLDVALLLSVIDGYADWLSIAPAPSFAPPRIGRLRGFFDDQIDRSYRKLIDETAKIFAAAGANVSDVTADLAMDGVIQMHRCIMATEAAFTHAPHWDEHADEYGPAIRSLIEEGLGISAIDYLTATSLQAEATNAFEAALGDNDLMIVPASLGTAPDRSTTGNPLMNSPWSYSGLPTISFPIGLAPDGMPLALQCVGAKMSESQLLSSAMWCENALRAAHGAEPLR